MAEAHVDKAHERLWALAGDWATSGHVVGDPPVPVSGSDVYEVLPGGYFVVHHVDVTVGAQAVRAIELIGERGSQEDTFLARSYDSEGNTELMEVTVDDEGTFHFSGGPEIAPAAQPANASTARVRSTLSIERDGNSMTALWERSEDGATWDRWMDMRFTRRPRPDRPPADLGRTG
jgi:hypothetical protein